VEVDMTEKTIVTRGQIEGRAILAAFEATNPAARTACDGWTAHDVEAHAAAGSKEIADLIEEHLRGERDRPTRTFDERETPFRAMSPVTLRTQLVAENKRKQAAYAALSELADPSILFTGARMTVDELAMHSRSEAAIHRWDIVGEDDVSTELLSQPELTAHAVKVLNRMPVLNESARAIGDRLNTSVEDKERKIVLHSPGQPDVVFVAAANEGRLEVMPGEADDDAFLTLDPAQRLLTLWGRRSAERGIETDGDPELLGLVSKAFWAKAQRWPRGPFGRGQA
jgi:Mycothiol maleylpyruvate isomerase N-terminal domain